MPSHTWTSRLRSDRAASPHRGGTGSASAGRSSARFVITAAVCSRRHAGGNRDDCFTSPLSSRDGSMRCWRLINRETRFFQQAVPMYMTAQAVGNPSTATLGGATLAAAAAWRG